MAGTTDGDRMESSADRLCALLASLLPENPVAAAEAVVEACGDTRVSVLQRQDLDWVVLAGAQDCADQSELAALECGAGVLRARAATIGAFAVVLAEPFDERISSTFDGHTASTLDRNLLQQVCVWLELTARATSSSDDLAALVDEAEVMRGVTHQILSARDLDQVLLSITNHTLRMSESDICGVFLREGDELRMRSCAGHRVVDTARLRMKRGQGVAGLVFETGKVAKIDSYLQDSTISSDFMSLAEQEATRSALAVPLVVHGDLIGVLEVWRRRYSSFTERDVRRLVALADLATIAIENGRLYDAQRATVDELESTRISLERQLSLLNRSATLQHSLIEIVLANTAVTSSVARTVGTDLGCGVAILSATGEVEATYPRTLDTAMLLRDVLGRHGALPHRATRLTASDGRTIWAHPVIAAENQYGAVCLVGGTEDADLMDVACGQAAMVCSLTQLQQRAASAARAEALDQILWDLMEGTAEQRSAARSRTHQMGIRLRGYHRIFYGVLENMDALAAQEGWNTSSSDALRRNILNAIRGCTQPTPLTLTSVRGNWVVALAPIKDRERSRDLLDALHKITTQAHPDLQISWGVSSACSDPTDYPTAFGEAKTAHAASRRLGTVSLYDELGIVRLLLGSSDNPDLQGFIKEVTQPLIEYDQQSDGSLLKTLRTFFDANCSQKDAAERLFVHPKTLAYRLDLIRKLTNLDLSRHSDRMRADLALRLLQVTRAVSDLDGDSPTFGV
ncbi:helix-turn-helix domain-containing protein [Rhodococcus pseudokoreensis]|uniref:Helix-turn-helix domain-containing protein n=1 Tax=Rhodococcus pseudokoreensis TaxID=2811421 RepID=A0A974ZUB8_9NOCA|nr:helix-turn-helix domain-containing protein [Rhodococcus pseudokoreensis]QSE90681.1 helix-turn-helix domain-containing protein [Rhodococcus pseudokoreensis]